MTSLRARLVLLLMVAITGVAMLAAFVTFKIIDRPVRQSFENSSAEEARVVSALLGGSAERARALGLKVGPAPDASSIVEDETLGVNRGLARLGIAWRVVVADGDATGSRYMVIPVGSGTFVSLAFPSLPGSAFGPLMAYLGFVVIGSVAVAILIANKIVSPLRMLEQAVASVGPDGELAVIDERGPVEVRATAKALNRLSQRLKAAMESRMRLVAAAGHDLRTPMTRMRLRAEFLPLDEQETWLKDLEELDRIADSAIRLVREEVAGDSGAGGVRLDRLIAEIGAELREVGRIVDWTSLSPLSVEGRSLALKRALRNLFDNAAKHGGGASVSVTVESDAAVVVIDDRGPGIPEDLLSRVFEPFFRVDIARRQVHPGAGLGFAIAKEIIDQAGGSIRIENREGGGLRQTVRLRLRPAADAD